jgi:hypothetical protein
MATEDFSAASLLLFDSELVSRGQLLFANIQLNAINHFCGGAAVIYPALRKKLGKSLFCGDFEIL